MGVRHTSYILDSYRVDKEVALSVRKKGGDGKAGGGCMRDYCPEYRSDEARRGCPTRDYA